MKIEEIKCWLQFLCMLLIILLFAIMSLFTMNLLFTVIGLGIAILINFNIYRMINIKEVDKE